MTRRTTPILNTPRRPLSFSRRKAEIENEASSSSSEHKQLLEGSESAVTKIKLQLTPYATISTPERRKSDSKAEWAFNESALSNDNKAEQIVEATATPILAETKNQTLFPSQIFKNPDYVSKMTTRKRRPFTIKHILQTYEAAMRGDDLIDMQKTSTTATTEIISKKTGKKRHQSGKRQQEEVNEEDLQRRHQLYEVIRNSKYNYAEMGKHVATMPPSAHYCDITGAPTQYKDPKTGLWYADASVYAFIHGNSPFSVNGQELSTQKIQQYLSIRGAGVHI